MRESKLIDTQSVPRDTIQDCGEVKNMKRKYATVTIKINQLYILISYTKKKKGLQVVALIH